MAVVYPIRSFRHTFTGNSPQISSGRIPQALPQDGAQTLKRLQGDSYVRSERQWAATRAERRVAEEAAQQARAAAAAKERKQQTIIGCTGKPLLWCWYIAGFRRIQGYAAVQHQQQ